MALHSLIASVLGDGHRGLEKCVGLSGHAGSIGALVVPFPPIGERHRVAGMVQVIFLVQGRVEPSLFVPAAPWLLQSSFIFEDRRR